MGVGCVAFALVPMPVYFLLRGGKIRETSAFAPGFGAAVEGARDGGCESDVEKFE